LAVFLVKDFQQSLAHKPRLPRTEFAKDVHAGTGADDNYTGLSS
jgi:hypothetical protein